MNRMYREKCMTEEELKKGMDEVYEIGFKNGGISMKNEILKKLNRDWNLWGYKKENMDLCIKVLKKINRIKVAPHKVKGE